MSEGRAVNASTRGLWAYRWWIAALTIVSAVAAFLVTSRLPARYTATTSAQVISGPEQAGTFVDQNSLLQLTNYYLAQAQTTPNAQAAAKALGQGVTANQIKSHVSVSALPDSQELQFVATSADATTAASYANAYAQAFSSRVSAQQDSTNQAAAAALQAQIIGLERQISSAPTQTQVATSLTAQLQALQTQAATLSTRAKDVINIIQPASAPGSPSSPTPKKDAALVGLIVLLLSLGAAYGLSNFNDRYRSADELARESGLVSLAEIPYLAMSEPVAVESFRSLRTAVEFVVHGLPEPALVFTSAAAGAGKTHVVSNLAGVLAAGDLHVALVDGDLRRPALHERLGLDRTPGFTDTLLKYNRARYSSNGSSPPAENEPLPQSTRTPRRPNSDVGSLEVIVAGTALADPANLLASEATGDFIDALRRSYDLVLFDSPPMLLSDASILARSASGVVLVVDARHDRRAAVRSVVQRLQSLQLPIVGFVFNGTKTKRHKGGYYYAAVAARSKRPSSITGAGGGAPDDAQRPSEGLPTPSEP